MLNTICLFRYNILYKWCKMVLRIATNSDSFVIELKHSLYDWNIIVLSNTNKTNYQ